MIHARILMVGLLAACSLAACNSGEFSGDSTGRAETPHKAEDDSVKPDPSTLDASKNTPTPGAASQNSNLANGSSGGSTANATNPSANTALGNVLQGMQANGDVPAAQVSDDEVVFGGAKVFHIGDGQFSGSSCHAGISAYPQTGRVYAFQFDVTQPSTSVTISIGQVCGVDYGTNFITINVGGQDAPVKTQPLQAGATQIQLGADNLAPGHYEIDVHAGLADDGYVAANDLDDFIVGQVRVTSSKPIRVGQVGTRDQ